MKANYFFVAGIMIGSAFVAALAADAKVLTLVKNGEANASIVVAADVTPQAQRAAEELQSYIARITGARLEIRSDEGSMDGARILVGKSRFVRDAGVEVPSGFTRDMNEDGYVIRTVGDALVLAGNEDGPYQGTLYAVYDLLGRLGCRWFFPGAYGEVVPNRATIAVDPINVLEKPDFRFRNIWYSGWMPVTPEQAVQFTTWQLHNRMNTLKGISLPGDGTIANLAPAEKYFESNPNIYAVNEKGERMKDMLCLSEPDAVTIAVKTITDAFRAHPDAWTFGFAPPDGHPRCYCPRCTAAEPGFTGKGFGEPSLSDTWFKFANAVAREVYKEFPDRWLFTNGYANRVRPPEGVGPLSPNLGIQSAMIDSCTFHRIDDPHCWQRQVYKTVLDRWTRDLKSVFIYDYDPGKSLDNLPFPMLHNLAPDMRYFRDRGVWGFWTEGNNNWMVTHLNYYVRSKLMWDVDADERAIVRDYCEKFYGDAARPVEEYIWTLEHAVETTQVHTTWGRLIPWQVVLPPATVEKLDHCIARANERAGSLDEATRLHLRVFTLTHDHTRAFLAMEDCAARGDFSGAVAQADAMMAIRNETASIDPALLPHTPDWCKDHRGTLEWFRKTYQTLAEQTGGTKGELVAMFPAQWEFRTDEREMGTLGQWYLPGNGGDWNMIDGTVYWEAQGYQDKVGWPYAGRAWYRGEVNIPAAAAGKPLRLTVGGVYSAGLWIWLNGLLIDHRVRQDAGTPFDIDVTAQIRPGETNTLAILVNTLPADRMARGGLYRRVFVWSPK